MTSIERQVYGPDSFLPHARATGALLKFCDDHKSTDPSVQDVRSCLAALEAGEKTNAIASFRRVRMGKEGFNEWWPPAVLASETDEHVWAVFEALVERWCRLMASLPDWR